MIENYERIYKIFTPEAFSETMAVEEEGRRFAYYTTAETAKMVLENQELWLRNATVMNDFSEITYGLSLVEETIYGEVGIEFRAAIDEIASGTISTVEEIINQQADDWKLETYFACISHHLKTENEAGRLSMWRAYGDTAIVINNGPLLASTDLLGVFSTPVIYQSREKYESQLIEVTASIRENREFLKSLGKDNLVLSIYCMCFFTAIASKHPGFSEEREWRIFYRPNDKLLGTAIKPGASLIKAETVVRNGIPQKIYKLPLKSIPEAGLHNADIPTLLDRIIIGPTRHPYVTVKAFEDILEKLGVQNIGDKIVVSDIPLRID